MSRARRTRPADHRCAEPVVPSGAARRQAAATGARSAVAPRRTALGPIRGRTAAGCLLPTDAAQGGDR
jgi:hypothetical protein